MISAYLDAFVMACPDLEAGQAVFEEFVDGLLAWRDLHASGDVALLISGKAAEALIESQQYPLWQPVETAIRQLGILHVQTKDIVDIVNVLLDRTTTIESALGLQDVLYETGCCAVPDAIAARHRSMVEDVEYLVVGMALRHLALGNLAAQHVLASRSVTSGSVIAISGKVALGEGESENDFDWPVAINGSFAIATSPDELYDGVEPTEVWKVACGERDEPLLRRAISEAATRLARHTGRPKRPWRLQREFTESVWKVTQLHKGGHARTALRSCAEAIYDENLGAAHRLRVDAGGNAEPLVRSTDEASAWRRDVDREYHLHYWSSAAGIELVSLGPHKDMRILE